MIAEEEAAKAGYEELMAAKEKEIAAATKAIEEKLQRQGELSVEIVQMKQSLTDAEEALIEDKKFLEDLEKNCATKEKEWAERCKMRQMELLALADTIKILNDDDALELFKKTLPSPSLIQLRTYAKKAQHKALALLKKAHLPGQGIDIDFITLALTGRKVDFSKVIKMIDDMVELLAKEQHDDDHKKEYCTKQLDFAEDKGKELTHNIEDLEKTIADNAEGISALKDELDGLAEGIKKLDDSVLEATIQRKKENEEYTELMSSNTAAAQLIEFAKNRMNKFYNPKLYKPPPKRELTEE